MSAPSRRIFPSVGRSKPAISRSVVVLPQPDGPSSEKNSPASIETSIPSTAATSPKCFRSWTSSTAPVFTSHLQRRDLVERAARSRWLRARRPTVDEIRKGDREQGYDNHHRRHGVERRRRGAARGAVDQHRDGRRRLVRRHVLRDDEVVDRQREDDDEARQDSRPEQREEDEPKGAELRGAEVARRLLVLRADREQPAPDDDDDVRDREGDLTERLRLRA